MSFSLLWSISVAQALPVVPSDTVDVAYADGIEMASSERPASWVGVTLTEQGESRWVLTVAVANSATEKVHFRPEDIEVMARLDDGTRTKQSPLDAQEALYFLRRRAKRQLTGARVANAIEGFAARDESKVDQKIIDELNDLEYEALRAQLEGRLAMEERVMLKANTLYPDGDAVGTIWIESGPVAIRHLMLRIPVGADHHLVQFGDPDFESDACRPDSQGALGWMRATRLLPPRRRARATFSSSYTTISLYTMPREADGGPRPQDAERSCTLWPNVPILLYQESFLERWPVYWVSVHAR